MKLENSGDSAILMLGIFIIFVIYFLPAVVAFARGHHYKWVIFALNTAAGWTGLAWVASLVWAVYPAEKSIADPVLGSPTGLSSRNSGDTWGSVQYGVTQGFSIEARNREARETPVLSQVQPEDAMKVALPKSSKSLPLADQLERLSGLMERGFISREEFEKIKQTLIRTHEVGND